MDYIDIRFSENETISYFSNLLIESTLVQEIDLKSKYPGMSKTEALQKSIKDSIDNNNPNLKHLK